MEAEWLQHDRSHRPVSYTHLDVYKRQTEGSVGNVVDMSEDCKNGLSEACLFQVVVFLFFVLRTIWIERQHRQRPPEFS